MEPQLSFHELINVLVNCTPMGQTEIVNNLLEWIITKDDYANDTNEFFSLSASTVSKYVNKDDPAPISKFAKLVLGHADTKRFQQEFDNHLNDYERDIVKKLRNLGVKDGNKELRPGNLSKVIGDILMDLVKENRLLKNSSKFPNVPDNSNKQKKLVNNTSNQLITKITDIYSKRFPNDNSYMKGFNFITSHRISIGNQDEEHFTVRTINFNNKLIPLLKKTPLLLTRVQLLPTDSVKDIDHPYGEHGLDEFPNTLPDDYPNYDIKKIHGERVYVDENGKPVKDNNGNILKAFWTFRDTVKPIPDVVYVCEVTSATITQKSESKVTITFIYDVLGEIPYKAVYANHAQLGIPEEMFFNNNSDYQFNSIDILNRLSRILNDDN